MKMTPERRTVAVNTLLSDGQDLEVTRRIDFGGTHRMLGIDAQKRRNQIYPA